MESPTTTVPTTVPTTAPAAVSGTVSGGTSNDAHVTDATVESDLLVEEISIDGMCGVY